MYNYKRFPSRPKYTPRRIFKRGYARPSISNYVRTKPETKVMDWTSSIPFPANGQFEMDFWFNKINFTRLVGCSQGTSIRERVGNKIKLKNTRFKMLLTASRTDNNNDVETALPAYTSNANATDIGSTYQAGYNVPPEVIEQGPAAVRAWVQINGNDGWVTRDDDAGGTGTYNSVVGRSATQTTNTASIATTYTLNTTQAKYRRTTFRIMVINDRQQQPNKVTISADEVLEPLHNSSTNEAWSTGSPGVLSNLNAANFGRYQVYYDKTFTVDGDDPVKMITFDIKKQLVQSYTGPGFDSVRDGSLYYAVFQMVPQANAVSNLASGQVNMTTRTTYTDC